MQLVGTVSELWRYPVKSMAGEPLERCFIGSRGVLGDRGWALRDEKAGEIRRAKKLPASILRLRPAYLGEPSPDEIPPVEIEFPDGTRTRTGAADTEAKLSAYLGRPVTIWPLQPPEAREHYRRAAPDNLDMTKELREIFGRLEDEPLPDFSEFPAEVVEYTSPLGTYFDAYPLHVVTTATLAALGKLNAGAQFDVRRFRPNMLIATRHEIKGLAETGWNRKTLRVGDARIKVEVGCARCVMTTLEQDGLPKDPSVLRTIVREAAQHLGVYATVAKPGYVRLGDPVELI
jgi:MOSC domain-containing protein